MRRRPPNARRQRFLKGEFIRLGFFSAVASENNSGNLTSFREFKGAAV
jgi:hypothetical protein